MKLEKNINDINMESFIDDKKEWENNIFKVLKTYYSDFDHSYIQKKCFDNFIHITELIRLQRRRNRFYRSSL